jgi:hypothetical protein
VLPLKAFCKCCQGELKLPLFESEPLGETNLLHADSAPIPLSGMFCGELLALSEMLTEAVRIPLPEGENVALMVQLPPAATDVPHVLLCEKSAAFKPVTRMLVMLKGVPPLLVRVTV